MPRCGYTSSRSFISGEQNHSPENMYIDLCKRCYPQIVGKDDDQPDIETMRTCLNIPADIPDKFIFAGDEHPFYAGEDYDCSSCNKRLTKADD